MYWRIEFVAKDGLLPHIYECIVKADSEEDAMSKFLNHMSKVLKEERGEIIISSRTKVERLNVIDGVIYHSYKSGR